METKNKQSKSNNTHTNHTIQDNKKRKHEMKNETHKYENPKQWIRETEYENPKHEYENLCKGLSKSEKRKSKNPKPKTKKPQT